IEHREVAARGGVTGEERAAPQRLTVSISLWLSHEARDLADKIQNTVNYSAVADETTQYVRSQSFDLIETLADGLARHLLKIFPTQKVTVEVRKFPLKDAKYVSA